MRNMLAVAALATTVLAGSALPSFAVTVSPVTIIPVANEGFGGTAVSPKGPFTVDFTFTTPVMGQISAIISNAAKSVTFTSLTIYNSLKTVVFGSSTTTTPGAGGGIAISATSTSTVLPPGNYIAEVIGTSKVNVATLAADISVSAVPLPTSVALFGTAVLGFGLVGAARRKSKTVASSAAV